MRMTFRLVSMVVLAAGVVAGVAFGAGVAYGHGNRTPAAATVTPQQLAAYAGGGAAGAFSGGLGTSRTGAFGGAGGAAGGLTSGKITAVQGQTVTIDTRQGTETVNLGPSATVSKVVPGSSSDLTVGTEIIAFGTRGSNGTFSATSVSQVPPELASIFGGGPAAGGTQGPSGTASSGRPQRSGTPSPSGTASTGRPQRSGTPSAGQ